MMDQSTLKHGVRGLAGLVPQVIPAVLALIAVLGVFGIAAAGAGEVRYAVPLGDEKPSEPGLVLPRVVFDCSVARDTLNVSRGYVDTIHGDTSDSQNLIPGYSCRGWNESGPEHVYRLDVPQAVELWVGLRDLGDNDLDIFLLTDCDSETCVIGENTEFAVGLEAGTYYLVVDGYGGAEGPYTLVMSGRHPGVPEEICEPGGAIAITPDDVSLPLNHEGNIFEQPNLIQAYDCSPTLQTGGEVWYAVSLADSATLDAQLTSVAASLDACLWLFDDCGVAPVCLAFADDYGSGQSESLDYINVTGTATTVYLAVDGFRPADNEFAGAFTLGGMVGATRISWSRLRAMYR